MPDFAKVATQCLCVCVCVSVCVGVCVCTLAATIVVKKRDLDHNNQGIKENMILSLT